MSQPVDSVENRVQALLQSNKANFNDWLLLIAEVEDSSPDDMQKICIVYDSFLSEYPLCYGYWTRFAGHKARLCTMNDVEDVYERAVKIASHSVHLWVSYCKFAILSFEDPADVRRLFERGLSYVHKDYLCHLLWDIYIEYEYCQKQWKRLAHIYINTLRFPTRRLRNYYESFKKLVALLEEQMGHQNAAATCPEAVLNCEMTLMKDCVYSEFSNTVGFFGEILAGTEALKKYLAIGELLYHKSMQLDKSISCFETHIHRPFFHIMPLDDLQLQNWHKYLTFVEEQGNFNWTVKLYERCLIPCANYSEFWIRYVDFADDKGGREIANDALERALRIFLKRIPAFHSYYLLFKEKIGDAFNARALLQSSDDCAIDVIENVNRNANMEKRMGNIKAAQEIYVKAIKLAYEKQNLKSHTLLYINFARFTFVVTGRVDAAKEVFIEGIQKLPCKLIIEEFLNFITLHGGANHLFTVDCMIADLISSESNVFLALSPHDREEISQIYLKFVDLHGTIYESRQAWDRHRKLFPHILRPLSVCDYSFKGFKFQSKKSNESKVMQTKSPNHSNENLNKNILDETVVKNRSSINTLITLPEASLNCELESNVKADNEKESRESLEAETTNVHELLIPAESEMNIMNKPVIESQNAGKMLNAISEYHDGEMPVEGLITKNNNENLELPTLDNLTICSKDYATMETRTICSHDNNTSQEAASKEDGSKSAVEGSSDCEGLVVHLSGEKNFKFDFESEEKREDGDIHSMSANRSPEIINSDIESQRSGIKEEAQLKIQEKMNSNLALPVNSEHPQISAGGGQWAHNSFGAQCIPIPNSVLQGYIQSFESQQWQALAQLQNQSGMTNQQMPLIQSFTSQTASVPNSQDPQASYTQFQYQLAASQAYTNPDPGFFGKCMQQSTVVYSPDQQVQHPPYQTQIQLYQNASQSDDWYSYYQSAQGFPPHIWQHYQNLYYLQQQQLQQRQQDQQLNNSNKNQLIDPSEARNIEQELHENQVGQVQLQVQIDTLQHRNLDEKLNVTGLQQNQQDNQYESAQSIQQSVQTMNSEQSQCLYLQQQQNYYIQQQQYQMYLQQHQQFLHFQQQQLLYQQKQLQQQRPILPLQQHQPLYLLQQHQAPMQQQDYQQQQQPNALELKPLESKAYSQGKGDTLPNAEHLAISPTKQSDNSPNH